MGIDDGTPARHSNINTASHGSNHLVGTSYERAARIEALFVRMDERLARIIELAEESLRLIRALQEAEKSAGPHNPAGPDACL